MKKSVKQDLASHEIALSAYSVVSIALIFLILLGAGVLVDLKLPNHGVSLLLRFGGIGVCLFCLAILGFRRGRYSMNLLSTLFLLELLPAFPISWVGQSTGALSNQPWAPFVAYKLVFVILSLCVVGGGRLNLLAIVGIALEAILFWNWYDLGNRPSILSAGEPIYTVGAAVVALCLLYYRHRYGTITRELALAQARATLMEQVAKIFLSVRDKTNTPLQTIEFSVEKLRGRNPHMEKDADVILQSLEKIKLLQNIFKEFESEINWNGEEVFDELELVRSLKGDS